MLPLLLYPFSIVYGWIASFRNFLYDHGLKKSYSFDQAVICVGNLSVGGTGKTPMIEYLVKLLGHKYSIAILSRGYGRKTNGFRLASSNDDASTIGDEPFQFFRKFGSYLAVVVCESRVQGIAQLLELQPNINLILLDDAFQHRAVRPLFSILLTDFSKPFFNDHVLPQGRLREPRNGSKRADAVMVTKCVAVDKNFELEIQKSIHRYAGAKPVFFSGIRYQEPVSMGLRRRIEKNIILVTGIANSAILEEYITLHFNVIHHFCFDDHHDYSIADIENIKRKINKLDTCILTTEKDMVKLISPTLAHAVDKNHWFYLPIETYFLNDGSKFDKLITEKIETHLNT